MADSEQSSLWDTVIKQIREAQEQSSDPLLWSVQVSSILGSAGVSLPSIELANVMVSYICWENNVPILWKFLEKAIVYNMVPSMLVLAQLSSRVVPSRRFQPAAYRLYMELLKRHAFSLRSQINCPNYHMVMKSIDAILALSQIFGLKTSDAGTIVVGFIFSTVWQLIDASLDDEGLLEHSNPEKRSRWAIKPQEMEIDGCEKGTEHYERLRNQNTMMAIELITQFLQNKLTSKILNLAKQNMPTHWEAFIEQLQLLAENSSALQNTKVTSPEALLQLASDICIDKTKCKLRSHPVQKCYEIRESSVGLCHGIGRSSIWLPLDLVLEDAVTLTRVINATSLIETLTDLIKILQAINCATWHDTFLNLWIAALRLVQRERNPIDSPMPDHDSRMSMLLSLTTLVVASLIEEDESAKVDKIEHRFANQQEKQKGTGKSRHDLVSSLQMLGNFIGLLAPPRSAISQANCAAAKAMFFVSGTSVESAYLDCISMDNISVDFSGNMRHLIVEACIARNLLDTSAYFWPGYVKGCIKDLPSNAPSQVPSWSSLMQGAPLTPVLTKALLSTSAASLTELEKIFEIAVNGSDYEKISAATILCGASLSQGWNVQEHTAHFIIRLLSSPSSTNLCESGSSLIGHASLLNAILSGISTIDNIKIFSLLGMVPQLACSLMAICEIFGSCLPSSSGTQTTENDTSAHTVFSNGFTLLLKLWRFDRCFGARPADIPTVGSNLTLEYLLLLRNSHLTSSGDAKDCNKRRLASVASSSSAHPIYIDSFPNLKAWYNQHNACISSTLSGISHGIPVPHHVDELLNFMFKEKEAGRQSVDSTTSGSCSPFGADESTYLSKLPAWEILAAVHYVVDAALTACDNGRLSPRKLAMGLKVLVDFLPASLGTIVSYLTAEVTRGTWKPASMNGTDWPCPDANLSYVEEKIKTIVAASAVDVSSTSSEGIFLSGTRQATLPFPLAALVCLTIAYKTDKDSRRYLDLPSQVLASVAAGCPWPCTQIVYSLWSQKAKRWSAFFVFSSSRTIFLQNQQALVQLLRSCFTATLGLHSDPFSHNGGIGALLGHGIASHAHDDNVSPVSPGILYMHVYPHLSDVFFLNKEIVTLLMECVREITRKKTAKNVRIQGQFEMASNLTQGKLVASLAASLVWSSGGLGLVQSLFEEFLPSWFVSDQSSSQGESTQVAWLKGYVVSYFASLCGAFVWGVGSSSSWGSKRRRKILGTHMEFLVGVLKGQMMVRCDEITWRAYVLGFISLMVICMPTWVLEVDVHVLKIISKKLSEWNETELAMELLGIGGADFMGAAVEMIIEREP